MSHSGPGTRSWFLLVAAALSMVGGCGTSRDRVDESVLAQRRQSLAADQATLLEGVTAKLSARLEHQITAPVSTQDAPDPVLNLLVISGGGDWGAFATGFLSGWGLVQDPGFKRPGFDLVWGVSTGAIIAPFAFVGSHQSYERIEWFYRHPERDWVGLRDWFSWLPWRPSIMRTDGLERAIKTALSDEIIAEIADRSRAGGTLLVAAAQLDYGLRVLWDVGAECERAAESGNPQRVLSVLHASSAIPALFAPVLLEDGLYADGGATAILLSNPDYNAPHMFMTQWRKKHPSAKPPMIRCWFVMSIQTRQAPTFVEPKWPKVGMAALDASVRSAAWLQACLMAAQLDYINAKGWARCELRAVTVPDDWKPSAKGDFHPKTMNELADIGRKMGADPRSWRLLTVPMSEN